MALLVFNIETATSSMISSLDRHCADRVADGSSAIDPTRSHLNEILHGSEDGVNASLKAFYDGGVKRPTKQAESPYLRIVVGASPEYFRDDPAAVGTWNNDRLDEWRDATMNQLFSEFGDDVVHAELHLDEDTPHIHCVVAPTYLKKPRMPGRQKRGETEKAFEARKEAARTSPGVRTVGRASHETIAKLGSFQRMRERMAVALDHLGIEYGEDRHGQADAKTTAQWVKEQAHQIREDRAKLDAEKKVFEEAKADFLERATKASHNIKSGQQKLANDQKAFAVEVEKKRKEQDALITELRTMKALISKNWKKLTDFMRDFARKPEKSTFEQMQEHEAKRAGLDVRNIMARLDELTAEEPTEETGPTVGS
ncbi:hypothetical protein HJ526_19205 [Donghicola sp. C2-DW-16]|uniref:Plasmid recombination enzyme n=1 Tax=Donghicola mangrovi TaxID=2729614 RepID=A0ABX2PJ49_9RHOB|nr:plasmid recombination protein [Donghicola mangrovi]NVO29547.1 hypothetical protein [Donghicola mangrovi]